MSAKPKLDIVPNGSTAIQRRDLDAFHEDRVLNDLGRLAESEGLLDQLAERLRVRFQKNGERAILEHWIAFYQDGARLLAAKTEMERRKSEYMQLSREHDAKEAEKRANLAKVEADTEEYRLRRDKAEYQRKHLERFVEGTTARTGSDIEQKLHEAQERRQLDARWELSESLRALQTLIELQHWRRQQRDRILQDRSLSSQEQSEDLQFIDELFEQKRGELRVDTRIFEEH